MKPRPTLQERQKYASSLLDYTRTLDGFVSDHMQRNGIAGRNMYSFVLEHGIGRWGTPLPRGLRKLADRLCFQHATQLALSHDRYVYCEGLAITTTLGFLTHHAWALDRDENYRVVDNTWKHPVNGIYLGVPFNRDFMNREILKNKCYGILPCYEPVEEKWLYENRHLIPRDFQNSLDKPNG